MFLEPDPRRNLLLRPASSTSTISLASIKDAKPNTPHKPTSVIKRKPLQERSRSEINQQTPRQRLQKSTVRLVQHSPSPTRSTPWTSRSQDSARICEAREMVLYRGVARERAAQAVARRLSFSQIMDPRESSMSVRSIDESLDLSEAEGSPSRRTTVASFSDFPQLPKLDLPPRVALFPDLRRYTASSGEYSNIFSIPETESTFASSMSRSDWFSDFSTLRDTSTTIEKGLDDSVEYTWQDPGKKSLEDSEQATPIKTTIRPVVDPGEESGPSQPLSCEFGDQSIPRLDAESKLERSFWSPYSKARTPQPPGTDSDKADSPLGSGSGDEESGVSFAAEGASSPIITVYESDKSHSQSPDHHVKHTASLGSIDSRLQYPTLTQGMSSRALTTQSSRATLHESAVEATPPSLSMIKKRSDMMHSQLAMTSNKESRASAMSPYDHLRRNRRSREDLGQDGERDHSSLASGNSNWTIASDISSDDDVDAMHDGAGSLRRSTQADTFAQALSQSSTATFSIADSEPGDMTLGIYREESAKPQPLFRSEQFWFAQSFKEASLLPPPIPINEHDAEHDDTLMELQPNALHGKRSAKSLRHQRSYNLSERSRPFSQISMVESDRLSIASSVFPGWAKRYYGGQMNLLSASRVSLARPRTPKTARSREHQRSRSDRTLRSYFSSRSLRSRFDTGRSTQSGSRDSHGFLPAALRTRFGPRLGTLIGQKRFSKGKAPVLPCNDSLEDGPDHTSTGLVSDDVGHPVAQLENAVETETKRRTWEHDRPTIRRVSRGRARPTENNQSRFVLHSIFPQTADVRHMQDSDSKSSRSPFRIMPTPHLTIDKRTSHAPASIWQSPSFVGSLDSILRSKVDRQVILFMLGFIFPLAWMLAAFLSIPEAPSSSTDLEKNAFGQEISDIDRVILRHSAGDLEKRTFEEKQHAKGRWWRTLNRLMSVVGVLILAAIIAIAVVATR